MPLLDHCDVVDYTGVVHVERYNALDERWREKKAKEDERANERTWQEGKEKGYGEGKKEKRVQCAWSKVALTWADRRGQGRLP